MLSFFALTEEASRMIRFSLNSVVLLGTYHILFRYYEKRSITELRLKNLPREGLSGFVLGIIAVSLIVLILAIMGCYEVLSISSQISILVYPLVVLAFLSIYEEILFRGIFYRITEESLGTNWALFASFLLFGGVHLTNDNANMISVLSAGMGGVLLSVMFSLTRGLWLPIFFHWGWNFTQVFYGLTVSGTDEFISYGFFQSAVEGSELITGGAFGPENSVVTIGMVFILSVGLYYFASRKGELKRPYWKGNVHS
jgi:membrane protease YdiL (CAAX protease family)